MKFPESQLVCFALGRRTPAVDIHMDTTMLEALWLSHRHTHTLTNVCYVEYVSFSVKNYTSCVVENYKHIIIIKYGLNKDGENGEMGNLLFMSVC